jgi:histidinol-phosphate aminotransferase
MADPSSPTRADVEAVVRPEVRALAAYHVPPAGARVKLDAMESPYAWPGDLGEAWLEALRGAQVNRYPDPGARGLKARLREVMGVPAGAGLLLGNGSDEIIQILLTAVGGAGRTVLAPEPTFVMYRQIALSLGLGFVAVPLRGQDFSLDLEATLAAVRAHAPAAVFLAYPNNPTGNLFPEEAVRRVLAEAPGLVVVDEAYTPFAGETFLDALADYPRLLVMRTVSKLGLAGLRLGWLAGAEAWVSELEKVRLPYNINVLTQLSAEFALRHFERIEAATARVREDREELYRALGALPGVTVWPSRANFILFRVPAGRAGPVFQGLEDRGVLIKKLDGSHPLLADCLRVTVGTPAENAAFLSALRESLRETGTP